MGEKTTGSIMGLWKFHERVGGRELIEVANELAKDENYIHLYIRKVSKNQNGIGFTYASDGTDEAYEAYFDKTSDSLKRKFGNDLVGWDVSNDAVTVKGF